MKLLVTGGAGFIGSNFIRYWLAAHPSDQIINIDALTYAGNPRNLDGVPPSHALVCEDICDADLDDSGLVNVVDLGLFKLVFFSADPDADFDGDGVVNVVDLGIMKLAFFAPPGPSGLAPQSTASRRAPR